MSAPLTVVEHLLEGRDALVLEVRRLTAAIDELDAVIVRVGGEDRRPAPLGNPGASPATAARKSPEHVNLQPGTETSAAPSRMRPGAGKATPRKAQRTPARQSVPGRRARSPKSIREHVLDMLAAEDRDFGLTEIIDRIHGQGIAAHDDAVRSITIKLMKDGTVERPSRGLYRLARTDGVASSQTSEPAADPAPLAVPEGEPTRVVAEQAATPSPAGAADYTPPLNLGQPWDRRG